MLKKHTVDFEWHFQQAVANLNMMTADIVDLNLIEVVVHIAVVVVGEVVMQSTWVDFVASVVHVKKIKQIL